MNGQINKMEKDKNSLSNSDINPEITRRLKIAIFSQPEYFRFMYESDLDSFADVFEFKLNFSLKAADYKQIIEWNADFNFFFRGEFLPDGVLEQMSGIRVAFSSEPFPRKISGYYEYTLDSIQRYFAFRSIRKKPFDYVFHYDSASLPLFQKDKLFISGEFAFPVATSIYAPKENIKKWDIFFIGRSTSHREKYFGPLKHYFQFLHICHGVWGPSLVDFLSSAKICLNIHAENEVSWEPRMQMMLACGAFVISEKISPNDYLRAGIDYIEVNSPKELYSAVEYYLENEAQRIKISESGRLRVLQLLNSKACFEALISDLDHGKYSKFKAGKASMVLNLIEKLVNFLIKYKLYLRTILNKKFEV